VASLRLAGWGNLNWYALIAPPTAISSLSETALPASPCTGFVPSNTPHPSRRKRRSTFSHKGRREELTMRPSENRRCWRLAATAMQASPSPLVGEGGRARWRSRRKRGRM